MAIKPKLQSLLASANETTGQERDNLTDAMQDLVDGYGQGGELPSTEVSYKSNETYRGIYISNGNGFLGTNSQSYRWGLLYKNDKSNFVFNPASATNNIRVCIKLKSPPSFSSNAWPIAWIPSNVSPRGKGTEMFARIRGSNTTKGDFVPRALDSQGKDCVAPFNTPIDISTWYYVCIYQTQTISVFSLYDENGYLLECYPIVSNGFYNCTSQMGIGGGGGTGDDWTGSIDIAESFFEIDGACVWGKTNSRTANMGKFDFANPANFTKVDWIETTGTQLLDTGVYVQPTIKFDMDINVFTDVVDSSNRAFFMSNWDTSVPTGAIWSFRRESNGDWAQTLGNDAQVDTIAYGSDQMHSIHIESSNQTFDSVQYGTRSITSSYSSKTIKIGGGDFRWGSGSHMSHCQIGEIGIKLGTTSTRNLIPVYHNATGVRGAFDSVNNVFHANAGTGVFGIPSDTSGEINLAEYLASLT